MEEDKKMNETINKKMTTKMKLGKQDALIKYPIYPKDLLLRTSANHSNNLKFI